MIEFRFDDGGRSKAGFKGTTGDCVTRSIAIATQIPYIEVYNRINEIAKTTISRKGQKPSSARSGVHRPVYEQYLSELGWTWKATMFIGQGCRVHLCPDELPKGRLIVALSRHMTAVIDGVCHDVDDPSRGGTRCVYGYFYKE